MIQQQQTKQNMNNKIIINNVIQTKVIINTPDVDS